MIRFLRKVLAFISNLFLFFIFILNALCNFIRLKRFPYKKTKSGRLTLLANAPSLKEVLPRVLTDEEFKNTDFVVLNFFANCEEFSKIKPQHYCFADPMFFKKQHKYEEVRSIFNKLDTEVDWQMSIYIPAQCKSDFIKLSHFSNPNLKVVPINDTKYKGFPIFANWFYKHNLAAPIFSTVAIEAIYLGINSGYDQIDLYGVDHTFFDGLCVNENNEVCTLEKHFYNDTPVLKPIVRNDTSKVYKMSDYVHYIGLMFISHNVMRSYSDYLKVDIFNHTKCSLIDSYKRK